MKSYRRCTCSKSGWDTLRFVSTHFTKRCLCFKCPKISFGWLQALGQIFYALQLNVPKQKGKAVILSWTHIVSFSSVQLWPLTQAQVLPQESFFDQCTPWSSPIAISNNFLGKVSLICKYANKASTVDSSEWHSSVLLVKLSIVAHATFLASVIDFPKILAWEMQFSCHSSTL